MRARSNKPRSGKAARAAGNRRKTVERRFSLSRLFGPPCNRRLQPRRAPDGTDAGDGPAASRGSGQLAAPAQRSEATGAACPRPARPPRDWRGAGRSAARGLLLAVKLVLLLAALGAIALGGFVGYRRAASSTYFTVKQLEVRGARRAPREEIVRLVQSLRGRSIFRVDLGEVQRAARTHPWVKDAVARRELPDRVAIELEEHRAQALLLLGHLYLVNGDGEVFKRAGLDEVEGLPVITGVDRVGYLNDPAAARRRVRLALATLERYQAAVRPSLSEVNVGARDEITLHLKNGGLAVRFGGDASAASNERLARFDAVWAVLGPDTRRARVVFLDNEIRADRVTVRMGSEL